MSEQGAQSIESLASGAIAAGCLQAVMSMVHPELVKFVSFQKERVARTDAQRPAVTTSRHSRRSKPEDTDNLSPEQQTDLSFQLKYLRRYWHSHLRYYGLDPELPGVVQRALMYRNKVSHQSQMTLAQYEDAIATFERLADIIECNALVRQQIKDLVTKLLSFSPLSKTQETQIELKEEKIQVKETKREEPVPLTASLDQILQHNYLYDGEEDEEPLWVDLKLIGNDYFKEGNYTEAIEAYSQGLDVAPNKAVLFGNRAMCYLRLKEFECAREDAEDAMDADNYENVKYYRLLSEALMGLEGYDEAKEICDEGLELDPQDATLLKRKRTAEMMIAKEKAADEKEKKRREKEERARVEAANAVAKAEDPPKPKSKSNKKKNKLKPKAPEMELVPMINYQEVPQKWIEVHTRGSRRLEMYEQGMEGLVVAAKALLQVTDSIGMPGRSKLPLDQLVRSGMAHLRQSGEAGVAEAWFRLGVLYSSNVRKGMPLTADPHKMLECFNKAASLRPFIKPPGNRVFPHQGVAEAENELGVCYRDGRPAPVVEVDLKRAFQFFLRSAEHDLPLGQYNVAVAYATGSGTPCDPFAARMWTSRAAQHGLPEAQQYLAQLFEKGYGGKRDEKQAREWSLTAVQNRLTDLTMSHGFADVGVHPVTGGQIAEKFASNPVASQRGKEVFQELYDMYLNQEKNGKAAFDLGVDSDGEEIKVTKASSYTRSATSSSDHMGWIGIYRPPSAVIDAEIQARAKAGGLTACNYLASEKLLQSAGLSFTTGDIKSALRDLKKADLTWERPKGAFTTATSTADLLPAVLKEASVSLQINPRDIDAAYVVGRWEVMSDQDIIQHWKRCAKMHPNEACFHFYLGTAYMTLQRYNEAMDAMDAALTIEKKPDWLYWSAAPMIAMGMIDSAMSVYKEYVDSNPPDERFIPDAYYSIGALYFKKYDNAMATVYHELGQMAESVAIRFPAFHPHVLHDIPKETLRSGMKKNGYMDPSVIASVVAQNMVECGYCKANIKPTQILIHRLSKCPRRTVVCPDCNERMVFDCLQTHSQSLHPGSSKSKKKKSKKKKASQPSVITENIPGPSKTNGTVSLQELTSPKFHFAGAILNITKGKNNSTVFSLKTVIGQRWTIRVAPSSSSIRNDAFDAAIAIAEAEVDNSMLVFWRSSPPLEMIDRKALMVPMEGEVYGQDVAIYVVKCSSQVLGVEVCQLRHNKYMENGSLCSGCGIPPFPDEGLSACSACKAVKYCTRDCQKLHWKRIHRHMCKNASLLEFCSTLSEDVTPDERPGIKVDVATGKKSKEGKKETVTATISYEDVVYVDSMLEILEDIMETAKTKRSGPEVAEYYMLPPRDPRHPGVIEGSVRIFSRAKEFVAEFCIGYLTTTPSLLQQQELQYFFQIPPHNPLKLTCGTSQVFLGKCKAFSDDGGSRSYRLAMEMDLNTYTLPEVAEVLVYLLSTTNKFLK